ncbi:hypothetical protein JCM12141A_38120 [Mycolicibacterium hodleri]
MARTVGILAAECGNAVDIAGRDAAKATELAETVGGGTTTAEFGVAPAGAPTGHLAESNLGPPTCATSSEPSPGRWSWALNWVDQQRYCALPVPCHPSVPGVPFPPPPVPPAPPEPL